MMNIILKEYYNVSAVAQVYYKLKTGEELTKVQAFRRWAMTRHPDIRILKKSLDTIHKQTKLELLNQT